MFLRAFILLCLLLAPLQAAQRMRAEQQLRNYLRFPKTPYQLKLEFDHRSGFSILETTAPPRDTIIKLQQEIAAEPRNAQKHLPLARAFLAANDPIRSLAALKRYEELNRARLEQEPGNSAAAVNLAEALYYLNEPEECDKALRAALREPAVPADVRVKAGAILFSRGVDVLAGARGSLQETPLRTRLSRLRYRPPNFETVARADRYFNEAMEATAGGQPAATNATTVVVERTLLRIALAFVRLAVDESHNDESIAVPLPLVVFPQASEEALRGATRDDDDGDTSAEARILLALTTAAAAIPPTSVLEALSEFPTASAWQWLSERQRSEIRGWVSELENSVSALPAARAAERLEHLGLLQAFVMGNYRGAAATLSESVARDPSRAQAWELLCATLEHLNEQPQWSGAAESRLKNDASPHARFIAAKAAFAGNHAGKAIAHLQAGLRADPNHYACNLAFAVTMMKSSESGVWSARDALAKAERNAAGLSAAQLVELRVAQTIFLVLSGEEDRARQVLRTLLSNSRGRADALSILEIIGG